MSIGSGLFSKMLSHFSHLVKPSGGFQGEFFDLRKDIVTTLSPLKASVIQEFDTPVGLSAPGTTTLHAAALCTAAALTYHASDLVAAGLTQLTVWSRMLTFTSSAAGGGDQTEVPASVVVTGVNAAGATVSETVDLTGIAGSNAAGTVSTTNTWASITSIVFAAVSGSTGAKSKMAVGINAAYILYTTTTTVALMTLTASQLVQTDLANNPRALVFTTGSSNYGNVPATVRVLGTDINGFKIDETLSLANTSGGTATTVNSFAHVTSMAFSAATAPAPTVVVSPSAAFGLARTAKARCGYTLLLHEIVSGTGLVTNGVLTPPVDTASITGTADLTGSGVIAGLNGETLIIQANGKSITTTFVSPVTELDVVTQVNAACDAAGVTGATATIVSGKYLNVTVSSPDFVSTLRVMGGTANTALGFTSNTTAPSALPYGTYTPDNSHAPTGALSYAITYEADATLDRNTQQR